jgi:hypothetical protein
VEEKHINPEKETNTQSNNNNNNYNSIYLTAQRPITKRAREGKTHTNTRQF